MDAGDIDGGADGTDKSQKKIEYSKAMALFKELLKKENEAKKIALGLKGDSNEDTSGKFLKLIQQLALYYLR